jgi:hypothetical protein
MDPTLSLYCLIHASKNASNLNKLINDINNAIKDGACLNKEYYNYINDTWLRIPILEAINYFCPYEIIEYLYSHNPNLNDLESYRYEEDDDAFYIKGDIEAYLNNEINSKYRLNYHKKIAKIFNANIIENENERKIYLKKFIIGNYLINPYTNLHRDCNNYYIKFMKNYWANEENDINNANVIKSIFNKQFVLENLMKEQNKTHEELEIPEHPLLFAIYNLAHPEYIKYLKNKWYNTNELKIKTNRYHKMINLYNTTTNTLDIKLTLMDILKWMYIDIIHNNGFFKKYNNCSIQFHINLLDKYAEIFNIEYEKISYD